MDTVTSCPGRVVDILEASGAFDPGSNPGRGVLAFLIFFKKIIMIVTHRCKSRVSFLPLASQSRSQLQALRRCKIIPALKRNSGRHVRFLGWY